MLKISTNQMDAMAELRWKNYSRNLLKFFRSTGLQAFTRFDDATLLTLIERSVRRARHHGLRTAEGLVRFVSIYVLVEPGFDERSECQRYFASRADPDLKMHFLSNQILRYLRRHLAGVDLEQFSWRLR